MLNSPIGALATGLIASQRFDNVPNSEPFRNNFFVSSLLCGNAAAQLVFSMRTADDIADMLKDRAALQGRLAAQRFAILSGPSIAGAPVKGGKLTAIPGRYEGIAPPDATKRRWYKEGETKPFAIGDDYQLTEYPKNGAVVFVREEFETPAGFVTVASPTVKIPAVQDIAASGKDEKTTP